MNVSNNFSENAYLATCALIVYRKSNGEILCTLNEIEDGRIQPGAAVDGKKLAGLFNSIGDVDLKTALKMAWQDQRILARGPNSVLWYAPPCRREIFFSCTNKNLQRYSGKVFPYPGLVFLARRDQLAVYAVKARRPEAGTKLYHAPFWNISEHGQICLPSSARNRQHTPEEWENIFYNSAFSHAGTSPANISRTPFAKLVAALIRSKAEKFPSAELVPAKIDIAKFAERR